MRTRLPRAIRQAGPEIVLAIVVILGAVSLWLALKTSRYLDNAAREASHIYGLIIGALNDTTPGAETDALLQLAKRVTDTGLPVVVTDSAGTVSAAANLPFEAQLNDARVRSYARELDRSSPPLDIPGIGKIHYGSPPTSRRLTQLAVLQLALLILAVAVAVWAYRVAVARDRERLWVAMARESAHQLGTPIMSAEAWIERMTAPDPDLKKIASHLKTDLERLQRVARRFERIGRPARNDSVGLGALAERVAQYFEPRLPRRANAVSINVHAPGPGPMVTGDPVLLEWALESLVRNSVDALSGTGGTIDVEIAEDAHCATMRVRDNGPGVPVELRSRIFEPGVTTKSRGWGIGLALTRRIVEDVHGGAIQLEPVSPGASFKTELPLKGKP